MDEKLNKKRKKKFSKVIGRPTRTPHSVENNYNIDQTTSTPEQASRGHGP